MTRETHRLSNNRLAAPAVRDSNGIGIGILLVALMTVPHPTAAQHVDVSGNVSVTNKGISLIPSFTLGRPAAIFDVAIRNGRVGFEPQFRVGLDGKPWAFLFWGRYRPLKRGKFQLGLGGHPAVSFRTITTSINGAPSDVIVARRYLAGEVAPTYQLARHLNVGAYYLYSHGVEKDVVKHTQFLAARATVANVRVSHRYTLQITPQFYYLRTDKLDGFYVNSGVTLARENLPVSIAATVNKVIRTRVAGDDFLWNVSVNYAIK